MDRIAKKVNKRLKNARMRQIQAAAYAAQQAVALAGGSDDAASVAGLETCRRLFDEDFKAEREAEVAAKRAALSTPCPFKDSTWLKIPCNAARQALLVVGPAGIGKTQWALAQFKHPLHVDNVYKIKTLDPDVHDGIVFEPSMFNRLSGLETKQLVAIEDGPLCPLPRKAAFRIPSGMPLIFTGRSAEEVFSPEGLQHEGVRWRLKVVRVNDKMYTA